MHATSPSRLNSDINVTPLVDVCLVLLIIFMVVTPLLVTGLPVRLPTAATGDPLASQPLQITLLGDGTLFIGDAIVRIDEAPAALARARAAADRPVVVQADKALPYGRVVELLDACRASGFTNVGLAAQRPSS
jgi:biopolymer transport protein TolR